MAIDYNAAFQSAVVALEYLELHPPVVTTTFPATTANVYDDQTTESFDEEDLWKEVDEEHLWKEVDDFYFEEETNTSISTGNPRSKVSTVKNPKATTARSPSTVVTMVSTVDDTTTALETTIVDATTFETTTATTETKSATSTTIQQTTEIFLSSQFLNQSSTINLNSSRPHIPNTTGFTPVPTNNSITTSPTTPPKPVVIRLTLPQLRSSLPEQVVYCKYSVFYLLLSFLYRFALLL